MEAELEKEVVDSEVVSSKETVINMLYRCNLCRLIHNLYHYPLPQWQFAKSSVGTVGAILGIGYIRYFSPLTCHKYSDLNLYISQYIYRDPTI